MIWLIGGLLFLAGGFATIIGIVLLLVSRYYKRDMKPGLYVLLGGLLSLLISFPMCTIH